MIKAIIFDCYGVLTTEGWLPFKHEYFDHDPALFQQAEDLAVRVGAGHMEYDQFITDIAQLAGVSEQEARRRIETHTANTPLFTYIREELESHYKLGFLSNAGNDMLARLFSNEQIALFDEIHLSFQTGHVKPEPEAYLGIAGKLGCQPEECIFVDDQERYCTGAEAVGMHAIVYKTMDQLRAELTPLLT